MGGKVAGISGRTGRIVLLLDNARRISFVAAAPHVILPRLTLYTAPVEMCFDFCMVSEQGRSTTRVEQEDLAAR